VLEKTQGALICWSRTCRLGRLAHPVSSLWSGQSYFPSQNWVLFRHLPLVHRKFSGQVTYREKNDVCQKLAARPPQIFRAGHLPRVTRKYDQKLATRPPQVFRAGHLPREKRSVVKNLPLVHRKFTGQVTYSGKNDVCQKLASRPQQVFRAGRLPRTKRSVVKNLSLLHSKFSGQATYRG
jgi:hypothetical protein